MRSDHPPPLPAPGPPPASPGELAAAIKSDALLLGFSAAGIGAVELAQDETRLRAWLAAGRHGEMHYMARHGDKRSRPAELVPGTLTVVSVRLNYWPASARDAEAVLADPELGYVSRYAVGRDYHKFMRPRLAQLARRVARRIGPFGFRAYVDTGPVLEKPLARNAGLGWIGKHTNLIDDKAGSLFFLGELYTDLALPTDPPSTDHCGSCSACLTACPTGAITAPYQLDARLCISYLTIELEGAIPEDLRPLLGNRIYGCDDCQLVCPWNKFARLARQAGFEPRHGLDAPALGELMAWSESEFDERLAGSAIRRIGYERWQRNLAVALGNASATPEILAALTLAADSPSALVREHAGWALARHRARGTTGDPGPD